MYSDLSFGLISMVEIDMVLILDSSGDIGAHVWTDNGNMIYLRYFGKRTVANLKFILEKKLLSLISAQHVLIYHLIQLPGETG